MPPLELQSIVTPLFRGKNLRLYEAIVSDITIGLMNPKIQHLVFFALKDDARNYLRHHGVFGQKT